MGRVSTTVLLLVAALGAGCGAGENAHPRAAPRLPSHVARSLAAQSDALGASLEQGDACSAITRADALRRSARGLVAQGRVPRAFRQPLLRAVEALAAELPACAPLAEEEQENTGSGAVHGKHKGRAKGNDGKAKGNPGGRQ